MIQNYLAETAKRIPDQPAIVLDGVETTYGELNRKATALAWKFRESGLRKGDAVMMLMDNGAAYAAVFFGVLQAGGFLVPLNPANTAESVRYVANHCGARFVVCTARALELLEEWWMGSRPFMDTECDALAPDIAWGEVGNRGMTGREEVSDPEETALVLYTSGTTGKPKGVVLSHRNLKANTGSILAYIDLRPADRTLAILPFYYSYGNSLLMTHVASGATLVVENKFALVNRALQTLRKEEVTGFSGVPSHFSILLGRSKFLEQEWPHLRYLTCAGGGLPPAHIEKLRTALPDVRIHVMYGQTEGAARLSSLDPALVDVKRGSIGKGIPGVALRVVDADGIDVAPGGGEVGEIIAAGENIMKGYLGDPEATAEVLRGGWLHTGDLATVDEEGFVYICGRAKEFIKSGGYRISPQQVEEAILELPDVIECAVVGVPDPILGEGILAYVVFRSPSGAADPKGGLVNHIRERLPHYMVPTRIEPIDVIPKTESGKQKRVLLKEQAARSILDVPKIGSRAEG